MRLRNIPGAEEVIENCSFVMKNPEQLKGSWQSVFGNANPIHIEIGMGKGQFIIQMAKEHPDINYIGIEMYTSVLLRGVQKVEKLEEKMDNLRFLCVDAKNLPDIFAKDEVQKIYLNFSDPWPKDRHAKRRLPSREFLNRYDKFLLKDGDLEFKTDNEGLFLFALEELEPAGWKLKKKTMDLHHDEEMMKGNVMTEYEEKFSAKGNPIYKYIIYR